MLDLSTEAGEPARRQVMEIFLHLENRKERFSDLGAALERAMELVAAGQAPSAVSDTGECKLLGLPEIARLAAITAKAAPMGDQVARRAFAGLPAADLDDLCRWLAFRMRTAGANNRQRLALLGAILDAISPDE